ncbi:MAG: FhaA domain-containing protein [Acidobacteriota bacterium]
MNSEPKLGGVTNRVEFFIRRFFERVGGVIDFALRRTAVPRTDLAALVPHLEQAVDEGLRTEDNRIIAPNLIELRYDYESYTRMGAPRREFLERELTQNIYEYIYNRRYQTLAPVQVKIAYDAFTRGLAITAEFGEAKAAVLDSPQFNRQSDQQATPPSDKSCNVTLRNATNKWQARAMVKSNSDPAGIGRNVANTILIDDLSVSNFHAAFVLRGDGTLELADRNSANGTLINGVQLESGDRKIVRDGDRLQFGDVELKLELKMYDG